MLEPVELERLRHDAICVIIDAEAPFQSGPLGA